MRRSYVNMEHKSVDMRHDYYVNNNKFMSTYEITVLTIEFLSNVDEILIGTKLGLVVDLVKKTTCHD